MHEIAFPLLVGLIRLSTELFGDGLLGVKSLAMVAWLLASALLWRLGTAMGSELEGELRVIGLFTSTAYTRSPRDIPALAVAVGPSTTSSRSWTTWFSALADSTRRSIVTPRRRLWVSWSSIGVARRR